MVSDRYVNFLLDHFFRHQSIIQNGFPANVQIYTRGPFINTNRVHIMIRFPCNDIASLRTWEGYIHDVVDAVRDGLQGIGYINYQLLLMDHRQRLIEPTYNVFGNDDNANNNASALWEYIIGQLSNPIPFENFRDDFIGEWTDSGNSAILSTADFDVNNCVLLYRIIMDINNDNFPLFLYRLQPRINLLNNHIISAQIRENDRLIEEEEERRRRENSPNLRQLHEISSSSSSQDSYSSDDNIPLNQLFRRDSSSSDDNIPLNQLFRRDSSSSSDDNIPLNQLFRRHLSSIEEEHPADTGLYPSSSSSSLTSSYEDPRYGLRGDRSPEQELSTDYTTSSYTSSNTISSLNDLSDDVVSIASSTYYRMLTSSSEESESSSSSSSSDDDDIFQNVQYLPNRLISFPSTTNRFVPRERRSNTNYNLRRRVRTNPDVLAYLKGFTGVGRGLSSSSPWISLRRNTMKPFVKPSYQKWKK